MRSSRRTSWDAGSWASISIPIPYERLGHARESVGAMGWIDDGAADLGRTTKSKENSAFFAVPAA